MGAVYHVELKLRYDSAQSVIRATKDIVNAYEISYYDKDFSSIVSAIQLILPKRGFQINSQSNTALDCDCDFDASYSWEGVMQAWFDHLARLSAINDYSEITIYPDNGGEKGVVQNGKVNWSDLEEEDEDDDWDEDDSGSGMKVDDEVLQEAIDCINDFSLHEYDDFAVDNNTDLSDIGILYTTDGGDNEVELQVSVDLINPAMKYYINGELRNTDTYADLEDLITSDLADLDFQSLFEYGVQFAKKSDYDPEVSQYYIDMRED